MKSKLKQKTEVDIIITAFNNEDMISRCLENVKNQSFKKIKCFVIDDNSTDRTCEKIKKFRWVKLIKRGTNSGPSLNRNIGINTGNSKYIATLDSDTVLDKNWLMEQINCLEKNKDKKIGILASKLLFMKNPRIINSAGGHIKFPGIGYDLNAGEKNSKKFDNLKEVDYACSAAMLMRREMIEKIGAFDKTYFYGHEDTDLGWRARIAGYKVIYNPKALAYHYVNQTVKTMSKKVIFHGTKNRIRSIIKNCTLVSMPFYITAYFLISLGQTILMKHRLERINAWWWNLINISDTLKERKKVQNVKNIIS
ncbi:MAG: glycosyltransferase family 2 protein [Nanoarchaeota archaeon]|nr:glycosyltransferase family 2 protein [Nanoarchaeota archaeon]